MGHRRTVDELIACEQEKIRRYEARIARLKARRDASEAKQQARQRVLAGELLLVRASEDERIERWLDVALDATLTRARDRELFGLGTQPGHGAVPPWPLPDFSDRRVALARELAARVEGKGWDRAELMDRLGLNRRQVNKLLAGGYARRGHYDRLARELGLCVNEAFFLEAA